MRGPDTSIRLAVTGMGIVCAIGRNAEEVWESIIAGRDGIRSLSSFAGETFPTDIAAEVEGEIDEPTMRRGESRRLSRSDRLAIKAAREAWAQAISSGDVPGRDRAIVSSGTSTGGLLEGESYFVQREKKGGRKAPPSKVLQQPSSGPSDAVARDLGLSGGVFSNATACASGGAAIGQAGDLLRSGHADLAIAGGTDALCRLTYSGFNVLQAVDTKPCRPFDASRAGISLGEGAGYIVIERWVDAEARGATILAELGGYGASCDAHHPTAPADDGHGAAHAMRLAIREGEIEAKEVDYVNAHGTGTLLNDVAESLAIATAVRGDVPVSSSKSFFGHTLGAAGGLEAVVAILALRRQMAPPTLRFESAGEGCTLDYIPNEARPLSMRNVLSNTFGFGGSNVSLLFKAVER